MKLFQTSPFGFLTVHHSWYLAVGLYYDLKTYAIDSISLKDSERKDQSAEVAVCQIEETDI